MLFGGVVIGFNQPARLALVPSLVPRRDLARRAINSIVFNAARFIGPALAGLAIVGLGIAAVFLLNALSFLAFLFALWRLKLAPVGMPAKAGSVLGAVAEGLRYTIAHRGIGPILLLQALLAVSARPFVELLPGRRRRVRARRAGLAILSASVGIGAVAGGFGSRSWSTARRASPRWCW